MKTVHIVQDYVPEYRFSLWYNGELITCRDSYSFGECLDIAYKIGFTHYRFDGIDFKTGPRKITSTMINFFEVTA